MQDLTAKVRPKFAVIDYGMGNLRSVLKAWHHVGASACLVNDPQELIGFDALIFPGQGAIVDTMRLLKLSGFDTAIRDWVSSDKPFFGICLGLQALFEHSEEGDTQGLGILKGTVKRFKANPSLKIPHMGWNAVHFDTEDTITEGLLSGEDQFYFVHSYFIEPSDRSLVLFESDYGGKFVSGIHSGRLYATQFHPEKSQAKGLQLYRNFLKSI
ncbi:MAG: imidazole glycerol phosphate synthase subunit HisH [Verrucomicrobiota bacterium]|nr:imidazole glycerol phosphate synthase subunit HisH [Verrucomicrobiota bacterium]MEC8649439.1 imidazole glycerol phosphate synthase subunit HisH [Verrucomicrobiota bacterium]